MIEECTYVRIKLSPSEKSQINPRLSIDLRVNQRVKVRQILLVLKQRLQLEPESAMYLFHEGKFLQPNKVISDLRDN